jgi:hypothetical protein
METINQIIIIVVVVFVVGLVIYGASVKGFGPLYSQIGNMFDDLFGLGDKEEAGDGDFQPILSSASLLSKYAPQDFRGFYSLEREGKEVIRPSQKLVNDGNLGCLDSFSFPIVFNFRSSTTPPNDLKLYFVYDSRDKQVVTISSSKNGFDFLKFFSRDFFNKPLTEIQKELSLDEFNVNEIKKIVKNNFYITFINIFIGDYLKYETTGFSGEVKLKIFNPSELLENSYYFFKTSDSNFNPPRPGLNDLFELSKGNENSFYRKNWVSPEGVCNQISNKELYECDFELDGSFNPCIQLFERFCYVDVSESERKCNENCFCLSDYKDNDKVIFFLPGALREFNLKNPLDNLVSYSLKENKLVSEISYFPEKDRIISKETVYEK